MSHGHVAHAINWWTWDPARSPMGWFLLDFALFVALLAYFAAKPLRQALAERHNTLRRAVTQAAASHAKATTEQQLWSQKLAGLDGEIRDLENESRVDGEAEVARMLADAESRATQIRHESRAQAEQELRRAHEFLRQRTLAEVLKMAQDVAAKAITEDDQSRLLEAAGASLPKLPHRMSRGEHP